MEVGTRTVYPDPIEWGLTYGNISAIWNICEDQLDEALLEDSN